MGVYVDMARGKVQRFAVVYKGRRHFENVATPACALIRVWYKLMREFGDKVRQAAAASAPMPEADLNLATFKEFSKVATARPSLRW